MNEGWDMVMGHLVKYTEEVSSSPSRVCGLLDQLFDSLSSQLPPERIQSTSDEPATRAGFIYQAGVGFYERGQRELAIAVFEHALDMYRTINGVEGKQGIYSCYGHICYCYRAIGNQEKAIEYEKKTLQIEKQLRLAGVR